MDDGKQGRHLDDLTDVDVASCQFSDDDPVPVAARSAKALLSDECYRRWREELASLWVVT